MYSNPYQAYPALYGNPFSLPATDLSLLSVYPGATAAFSVRQLSSSATRSMRVRRASDNIETDIGFASGMLNVASLESFCAGTDGYIVLWYDQSGNNNNAYQYVAAQQPIIVTAGVVNKVGTYPAVVGTGATGMTMAFDGSPLANSPFYVSVVMSRVDAGNDIHAFSGTATATNQNLHIGWASNVLDRMGLYANDIGGPVLGFSGQQLELFAGQHSPVTGKQMWHDAPGTTYYSSGSNIVGLTSFAGAQLFKASSGSPKPMRISEVIMWNNAQSGNETQLRALVKTAFGIA